MQTIVSLLCAGLDKAPAVGAGVRPAKARETLDQRGELKENRRGAAAPRRDRVKSSVQATDANRGSPALSNPRTPMQRKDLPEISYRMGGIIADFLAYNRPSWEQFVARIEKTVFISYRRRDISWALAVYQYLTGQKYDVFFDFSSLSSGDFEQVIVSNIRARAHFVLILTPTALERCSEPGDWLRREIETAIDEKRNIIPLFFDGFDFGSPSVVEKLTGKISAIKRYNGLDIPPGYFPEAMERLSARYLNIPLNAVIHPVSTEVRKLVKEEQVAADKALLQKKQDLRDLIQSIGANPEGPGKVRFKNTAESPSPIENGSRITFQENRDRIKSFRFRRSSIVIGVVLVTTIIILGINIFEPRFNTRSTSNGVTPVGMRISPTDAMILANVPAGEFIMGSDTDDEDEKPAHPVFLDQYWIDQTEVTNAMYARCVGAGSCPLPVLVSSATRGSYYGNSTFDDYPVINVDWYMAKAYCEWAERRLPTEAEWEKAARGSNANIFPWGNRAPHTDLLNYARLQVGDTAEVGSYPDGSSPYGALDMAGNVWEWVADDYDETFYANSAYSNPSRIDWGEYRVLRGGSWWDGDFDVRSSHRMWDFPDRYHYLRGFRCAMSASK